jgi:2-keto-4-pentenoate hydratase
VIPGIEIVDSRFDEWTTIGAPSLIADNACNAAWIKGSLLTDWRGIDLAKQAVTVRVNGEVLREGSGANVLGHPIHALEWLVNSLGARGLGLKAGQYITTGVTTEVCWRSVETVSRPISVPSDQWICVRVSLFDAECRAAHCIAADFVAR